MKSSRGCLVEALKVPDVSVRLLHSAKLENSGKLFDVQTIGARNACDGRHARFTLYNKR